MAPGVLLPLSPVITRWGTWLKAVQYYAKHWDAFHQVIQSLNPDEAQSILECTELLNDFELPLSLAFIDANFSVLPIAIEKLEAHGLSLKSAVELVQNVKNKISHMYDQSYIAKIKTVLDKNPGFSILQEIASVLSGNTKESGKHFVKQLTSSDLTAFQYAPTVSCDVE